MKDLKSQRGFTLLELLIVIGILATLSVALVIVLNPSEIIAKSRDSQRISDLTTLKKAIGIYQVTTPNPKMAGTDNTGCKGTAFGTTWQLNTDYIYYSLPTESGTITGKALDGVTFTTGGASQVAKANLGKVDGTGWLPINFTTMSGGSPISALPVDPVNTIADLANPKSTDLVYRYICTEKDLTYEIHATLESTAYTVTDNKMQNDGGSANEYYEVGTSLNLLATEGAGGGGVNTYYFDGSDVPATDAGTSWSGVTNADDGDINTDATITASANPSVLKIEGTNAPASGGIITQVRIRDYGSYGGEVIVQGINIYTDGQGELLGGTGIGQVGGTEGYRDWVILSVPTGGWTWGKVQALEVYTQLGTFSSISATISIVEIEVTSS